MPTDARTHEGLRIAFLSYVETEKGLAGRGAVLVTDHVTKPLEFRCTTPIKPNPVQRTLYGETLRSYIAVDLVGHPLIDAIQEKPQVVIVQDVSFLDLRPKIPYYLVCLGKQGEQFRAPSMNHPKQESTDPGVLVCDSGKFQPLTSITHWKHSSELTAILDVLRPVFAVVDLLEPFARIEKAVAEVDRQQPLR